MRNYAPAIVTRARTCRAQSGSILELEGTLAYHDGRDNLSTLRKCPMRICNVSQYLACVLLSTAAAAQSTMPVPSVVAEDDVYSIVSPGNGSGPMWSFGCTTIVRDGERVIVSQMETGEGVPLLCNTRWKLLSRDNGEWKVFAEAQGYRQREPCPIGITADRGLFLSVNDSLHPPGAQYLDCEPHLLRFSLDDLAAAPLKVSPVWDIEKPYYTDHSYRGYGVDGPGNRLLLLNIDAKTSIEHWALMDSAGKTLANGGITFPIRSCYPQVAVKGSRGDVLAIGDIVEPVEEWRNYKFEQTKQKWDYVFRILYYTSSSDLTTTPFQAPIEIANVDATAGHISNNDLWIAPDGSAFILYSEQEVSSALMRDKYFPDKTLHSSLKLAIVKDGVITERHTLVQGSDTTSGGHARFHETPDGRLYAVAWIGSADAGNYLMPIYPRPEPDAKVKIPLTTPFGSFFLAGVRGGTAPSNTIDIFGHAKSGEVLSYAQVVLK